MSGVISPPAGQPLHVVFGAGQIGMPLAALLRERGCRVRMARRRGRAPPGVEVVHGDAGDAAFVSQAACDAAVLYHSMNPPYDTRVWERELPRWATSLTAAAGRAGARLVVLDNLYLLGRPAGKRLSEDSPIAPCTRKGEVRARVNEQLVAAHRRGDARITWGRASDFYGPGGTGTHFGDAFWPAALKSGAARMLINPEPLHTYHYTLDVAAGLATLGQAGDDVTGRTWMLPAAPAGSSRAMVERLARFLGRPLRVERMPGVIVAIGSMFVPILRELRQMSYQWEEAFVVDDSRFRERFGLAPTPLDDGARATVEWALVRYAVDSPTHERRPAA